MKKIEAIVRSEVAKNIANELHRNDIDGVTLIQSLGKGSGERPWIGGEHGHRIEFNAVDVIITIVDDSKVDFTIALISKIAHTGEKGDGIIFVSNIEEAYNITTNKKI